MSGPAEDRDLSFSQTQLGSVVKCEEVYAQRYGHHRKVRPSGAMSIGNAFDTGTSFNLAQKVETGEDMPKSDVIEIAVTDIEERKDTTEWTDTPFAKAKDEIPGLVGVYQDELAPKIDPAFVQRRIGLGFELDGEDAIFESYIDVEEKNGVLRDAKTAGKKWPPRKELKELQPTCYSMHQPKESLFAFDIVTRLKKPKIDTRTVYVTPEDKAGFGSGVVAIARRMLELKRDPDSARPTGRFNPFAWWCCKKQCGFHAECFKRWGIQIPD